MNPIYTSSLKAGSEEHEPLSHSHDAMPQLQAKRNQSLFSIRSVSRTSSLCCFGWCVLAAFVVSVICFLNQVATTKNAPAEIATATSAQEIKFGLPFILVTEGGCSGTTAFGDYTERIIVQHGLHYNKRVNFEFLHVDKNAYFKDIVKERNMTEEQKMENRDDLLLESIQRAQEAATESSSLLFFKSNIHWYKRLNLGAWNHGNISFAGIYRANVLDRCICMVRDCFGETIGVDTSVFGSNGTKTDVCFGRRQHPELDVRANFTDVKECLRRGQEKVDFVRNQGFHSIATEVLFQFENSMNDQDFEISISAWMKLLRPLLQGALYRGAVVKALEEGRGTRPQSSSSQENTVYNYKEVKDELGRLNKTSYLH